MRLLPYVCQRLMEAGISCRWQPFTELIMGRERPLNVPLNALHYINAWNAGTNVAYGLAYRDEPQKCRLDYSVVSLGRIVALLDVLRITRKPAREAFLA